MTESRALRCAGPEQVEPHLNITANSLRVSSPAKAKLELFFKDRPSTFPRHSSTFDGDEQAGVVGRNHSCYYRSVCEWSIRQNKYKAERRMKILIVGASGMIGSRVVANDCTG